MIQYALRLDRKGGINCVEAGRERSAEPADALTQRLNPSQL